MGKIMKTITKEQQKETMQNRIFSVTELNNQIYATEKVIKKKLHRPKKTSKEKSVFCCQLRKKEHRHRLMSLEKSYKYY